MCSVLSKHGWSVHAGCNITDLQVPLPFDGNWTGLSSEAGFRFEGGNVTYNGISEGSVAIYTTFGSYLVNSSQTFNTTCRNDEWDPLPTISVTIGTTSGRLCIYIHTLYVPCAFFCNMHVRIYIIIHDSLFMGGTMCIACERALGGTPCFIHNYA